MSGENSISAENQLAVMNLIARYAMCLDSMDGEGFVSLFKNDGLLEIGPLRIHGQAALGTWLASRTLPATTWRRHINGLPYITGSDERCTARTYWHVVVYEADNSRSLYSAGTYVDTVVNVDGRWAFEKREIHTGKDTADSHAVLEGE